MHANSDTDNHRERVAVPDPTAAPVRVRPEEIQQRHLAREVALQALYEIDCVNHKPGFVIDDLTERF